jgi:ribosomal protein L11 methyltransferase
LVITEVPGRKTIRVELFCEKKTSALAIQKDWGGSVREVKKQNWAAMAPDPPEPIKVRDKLVICSARTPKEVATTVETHGLAPRLTAMGLWPLPPPSSR